jgi:hypothetical protein
MVVSGIAAADSHDCFSSVALWLGTFLKPTIAIEPCLPRIEIQITLLSGRKLQTIAVNRSCTVEALKCEIQLLTDIPWVRQRLIHGDSSGPLDNNTCLGELADADDCVALNLIQVQRPLASDDEGYVNPDLLRQYVRECNVEKSLELLARSTLPGLNTKDSYNYSTVLHDAAWFGLADVCQSILERPDFTEADATDMHGLTALHCACHRGHTGVVRTLLMSSAFTDIESRDADLQRNGCGWSARDVAEACGHRSAVCAIDAATAAMCY